MKTESGLPCDDCGSSDAVTEYSNGSYCFSCKKMTPKKSVGVVSGLVKEFKKPLRKDSLKMPNSIPVQKGSLVDCFLKQRHFTDEQIFFYNIRQSLDGNALILCSWGKNPEQFYYEVRYLTPYIGMPKYVTIGKKDFGYNGKVISKKEIILVEDILSAMRIGWNYPCIALRGTKLTEALLSTLCTKQNPYTIITWFDDDEPGQRGAHEVLHKLSWCGFEHYNIVTPKDPKWYTDEEIKNILEGKSRGF